MSWVYTMLSFYLQMYILLLLLQFYKYILEKEIQVQNQSKDVWWLERCQKNYQSTSYLSKIIGIQLTSKPFWHWQNSKTCYYEIVLGLLFLSIPAYCGRITDLQLLSISTQYWKDLLMDYKTRLPYLQIGKEFSVDF